MRIVPRLALNFPLKFALAVSVTPMLADGNWRVSGYFVR
jgi:hypothetical protein